MTDKETGKLRKASYKDIVILLRTTSGWDEEFKEILEEEGIPAHVASKTGYFASTEIQDLLHLLQILDNPLQDIPFYFALTGRPLALSAFDAVSFRFLSASETPSSSVNNSSSVSFPGWGMSNRVFINSVWQGPNFLWKNIILIRKRTSEICLPQKHPHPP